ncbi:MAG: oligosaccharide flippase family protein [Lachnospiraceae bacterium]|nr:oligosaccharide flippase family protein [Lachnospiraceae bacterium]
MNHLLSEIKRRPLILGTIILTLAGLLSRLIGFFLRIYTAHLFTEEEIGIFQLIAPLLALSFVLTGAGLQTAVSSFAASHFARDDKAGAFSSLLSALFMGIGISALVTFLMYHFSEEIALHFLSEPRCAPCIRFIALSVPFCCIHSLVNGFCYSMKKSAFPAFSQLLEQILRFFVIAFVAFLCLKRNATCNISLCALGILVAEAAACIVSIGYLHLYLQKNKISLPSVSRILAGCPDLFRFVWPLTLSRFVVQFLLSAEAALIPAGLCHFGYPKEEALALYGILTGMALPFLLFPTAITGSLSVLLLPSISEAHAKNNTKKIRELTVRVIYAATLLGIFCSIFFYVPGKYLAAFLFQNEIAGQYTSSLSFLCPFLYLSACLGSIINGLGKTKITFLIQTFILLFKLLFVLFFIPRFGMNGYFTGLLSAQLLLCLLYLLALRKYLYYSSSVK